MLRPELQCFCRGADRVEEALVKTRHLTHVRIIGELFFFLKFTRHHVGRERRHPAVLARAHKIVGDLDVAVVVDLEFAKVQAIVGTLDDRRDRRLYETREPTAAQSTVASFQRFSLRRTTFGSSPILSSHRTLVDVHLNIMSVWVCHMHASTKHHPLVS